jgi:hypothetical protein
MCGRTGNWYVNNDGVSSQTPAAGASFGPFQTSAPPEGAVGYVRTFGTVASQITTGAWGCDIGFFLSGTTTGVFDASAYSGVSFWMKPGSTNTAASYYFEVPTAQTVAFTDGAFAMVTLTTPPAGVWTKVQVRWSNLAPAAWATATERVAFDPAAIDAIQWEVASGATQQAYDISIGDVEFLP